MEMFIPEVIEVDFLNTQSGGELHFHADWEWGFPLVSRTRPLAPGALLLAPGHVYLGTSAKSGGTHGNQTNCKTARPVSINEVVRPPTPTPLEP